MGAGAWALSMTQLVTQLLNSRLLVDSGKDNQIVVGIQNNTNSVFKVRANQRKEYESEQGIWTCLGGNQTGDDKKKGFDPGETIVINPGSNWIASGQRNNKNLTNAKLYINLAPDWGGEAVTLYVGSHNGGTVFFDYLVDTRYSVETSPQDSQRGNDLGLFTQHGASQNAFTAPAGQWGTGKNVFQFAWNATDGTSSKPAEIYVAITLIPA